MTSLSFFILYVKNIPIHSYIHIYIYIYILPVYQAVTLMVYNSLCGYYYFVEISDHL